MILITCEAFWWLSGITSERCPNDHFRDNVEGFERLKKFRDCFSLALEQFSIECAKPKPKYLL